MSLGYVKNTQEGRGAKDAQKCIFLLKMHFCASLARVYPLTMDLWLVEKVDLISLFEVFMVSVVISTVV